MGLITFWTGVVARYDYALSQKIEQMGELGQKKTPPERGPFLSGLWQCLRFERVNRVGRHHCLHLPSLGLAVQARIALSTRAAQRLSPLGQSAKLVQMLN